jgi:hypothetical protein
MYNLNFVENVFVCKIFAQHFNGPAMENLGTEIALEV